MQARGKRSEIPSSYRLRVLLTLFIGVLPALGTVLLIRLLGSKVLVLDEWGLPYFFHKLKDGELVLNILWSGNHEHRLVFPRLLFGLVAVATRWDPRVVMYDSVALVAISWAAFLFGFSKRFSLEGKRSIPVIGLCSLILFGPAQYENWLWAFQFPFFLILSCQLLGTALLMDQTQQVTTRFIWAAALSLIASFSSAHGLFSWVAFFPLILTVPGRTNRLRYAMIWLMLAATAWVVYLKDLDLSNSGGLKVLLFHPIKVVMFGLLLMGNPFIGTVSGGIKIILAPFLGLVILIFAVAGPVLLCRRAGWQSAAPFFTLLLMGLLPCAALSLGRLEDENATIALGSKYVTPVLPILLTAILAFYGLQAEEKQAGSGRGGDHTGSRFTFPRITGRLLDALCVLLLIGYLWNIPRSIGLAASESQRRKIADQFNMFSECLDQRIDGSLSPTPESQLFGINLWGLNNKSGMRELAAGGYRALVRDPVFLEDPENVNGTIAEVRQSPRQAAGVTALEVTGVCKLHSADQIAPFIFITNSGESKIIGASYIDHPNRGATKEFLWNVVVPKSLCRDEDHKQDLSSWVYDRVKAAFCLVGRRNFPDPP
jgi:hypothetical protein